MLFFTGANHRQLFCNFINRNFHSRQLRGRIMGSSLLALNGAAASGSEYPICFGESKRGRDATGGTAMSIFFGTIMPWCLVCAGAWLFYQLVRQNGRILLRLEALE